MSKHEFQESLSLICLDFKHDTIAMLSDYYNLPYRRKIKAEELLGIFRSRQLQNVSSGSVFANMKGYCRS